MFESIAVISDVHGNLEALTEVINDIQKRNIKTIICLGDIVAKGNSQKECLDIIREKCSIVLKGNCDEYFSSNIDLSNKSIEEKNRYNWNQSKMTDTDRVYLKSLPYSYELYISGKLVRFFHATPEKINGFVGNIDKLEKLYSQFLPSDNTISNDKADVVVYGHIHISFMQKLYNRILINAGSVGNAIDVFRNNLKDGNPKNTTVANYLIISGIINSTNINDTISFEFVNVPYNIEKELERNKDNIDLDSYKEEMLNGNYRNLETIHKSFIDRGIDIDEI